jgi:hypothetical protein
MDSRTAIKLGIDMGDVVAMGYLSDLNDDELMKRPYAACNHINWQIGHLIASENEMGNQAIPGSMPALPTGFAEKYSKEKAKSDDPSQFVRKAELMQVYQQQRAATLAALAKLSESDLDKPTGVDYAPTIGAMFSMHGSHWLMHVGQWVVVRRQLGKPILF